MAIRDLLQRFRPAGTPGAASGAAVPADRVAESAKELAPVFDELAGTWAEAASLRARASEQATGRRRAAAEEADRIRSAARMAAEAARTDAFSEARASAQTANAALVDRASRQAQALRDQAEMRLPTYVAQVVETALRIAAEPVDEASR